jgi:nucleoside-diphosphate-sugar epimerase
MRLFVTGANGFIGSHVVEALLDKGYQIKALIRKTADTRWINNLPLEIVYGAITDYSTVKESLKDVEGIIHIAGATKGKTYEDYYKVNVLGTKNLITAVKENGLNLEKFVYFSTIAVTGGVNPSEWISEEITPHPISWYGETKRKGEELVLKISSEVPVVILRLSAIYGPRDKELLRYFKFLKYRLRPVWPGEVSLCYVKDVAEATILALEKSLPSGTILNIADGQCYTIDEIGQIAEKLLGSKTVKFSVHADILAILGRLLSQLAGGQSILNPDKVKELTQPCWVCNIKKAQDFLGFTPKYSLQEGLKETINWYQKVGWL